MLKMLCNSSSVDSLARRPMSDGVFIDPVVVQNEILLR
jgi:hypothetical protein